MRTIMIVTAALLLTGCTRMALDSHLNRAYQAYYQGDCAKVAVELSKAERESRSRSYLQPEISLLRGQCLERESLFIDAQHTYQFIIARYPSSEYAYRAKARLHTLEQLGHTAAPVSVVSPSKR